MLHSLGREDLDLLCREVPVWKLILGPGPGLGAAIASVGLLIYNIFRALLTWLVAPLRDDQVSSGRTPFYFGDVDKPRPAITAGTFRNLSLRGTLRYWALIARRLPWAAGVLRPYFKELLYAYGPLFRLHQIVRVFFYLTFALALWHVWRSLATEITVPVGLLG
jgi:hypothetical protein